MNENRRKQTQRNGKHFNGMSVTGSSNENQHFFSSSIFKLNRHCLDELFDYLSLRDLHSLAQTCKSMQHMTGEFFTCNYSGANFTNDKSHFHEFNWIFWWQVLLQFIHRLKINIIVKSSFDYKNSPKSYVYFCRFIARSMFHCVVCTSFMCLYIFPLLLNGFEQ